MKRRRLTSLQRLAIFEKAKGRCHLCGMKIRAPGEKWEVEHVIPLAMGGKDDESNMRPAHADCHKVKSKKDAGNLAKCDRQRANHVGAKRSSWKQHPTLKRKVNGQVVAR